ncbi:MAG: hypothetical protein Tsb007_12270 [Rhizobacter sp.]
MIRSLPFIVLPALFILASGAAHAGPNDVGAVISSERQYTLQEVEVKKKLATFGLCDQPQNADALPTQPVAVQEDSCDYYQHYEATSAGPSNGGSCGGFVVAFGPLGDLKLNWKRYTLKATWGDQQLTQAQCSKARLSAVAWGERCTNADCTTFAWEKIGVPLSKKGTWGANSNRCHLEHQFINIQNHYRTLKVDVIASLQEGSQAVRKRARGDIRAERGNGKCINATQQPRGAPAQAASTATGTYTPQTRP